MMIWSIDIHDTPGTSSNQVAIMCSFRPGQPSSPIVISPNHTNTPFFATLYYVSQLFATIPSGGLVSTFPFPTSTQFVLSAVPLLSW